MVQVPGAADAATAGDAEEEQAATDAAETAEPACAAKQLSAVAAKTAQKPADPDRTPPFRGDPVPRPKKCRRVGVLPATDCFGPIPRSQGGCDPVTMTVEEFETVRLIDFEGLTQEECSESMEVSRTTVQGIYDTARKKIAEALVNGRRLIICGGNYEVCGDRGRGRRETGGCGKHRNRCGQEDNEP